MFESCDRFRQCTLARRPAIAQDQRDYRERLDSVSKTLASQQKGLDGRAERTAALQDVLRPSRHVLTGIIAARAQDKAVHALQDHISRRRSAIAMMSTKRQSRRHSGHVVCESIHRLVHFSQKRCWQGSILHGSPGRRLVRQMGQSELLPPLVNSVFRRAAYSLAERPWALVSSDTGPAPVTCM